MVHGRANDVMSSGAVVNALKKYDDGGDDPDLYVTKNEYAPQIARQQRCSDEVTLIYTENLVALTA